MNPRRHSLLVTALVTAIVAGSTLVWVARKSSEPPSGPQSTPPAGVARGDAASASQPRTGGRDPLRRPLDGVAPRRAPSGRAGDGPSPPQPAPRAFGAVQLRAVDLRDQRPLTGFAWSSVGEVPGMPSAGRAAGDTADLRVPLDRPAAVRVQAPGYSRSLAIDVSLRDGVGYRFVVARLVPELVGPGISLQVRDDHGRPVRDLRVKFEIQPRGPESRNLWRELWTRESSSDDGVHGFVELEAGRYRVHLLAIDGDDRPRMLLPVTRRVTFDGANRVDAVVDLAPAGSIVLAVEDPGTGAPLGPGLTVALLRDGVPRPASWITVDRNPHMVTAGTLPAAEPCELSEPVPPGPYTVVVSGRGLAIRRNVLIWAGQRTLCKLP